MVSKSSRKKFLNKNNILEKIVGGEGEIRTPDRLAPMPHFECGAFDHSATSPQIGLEAKVEGRDSTGSVVPQDISRPAVNLFGLKGAMMFFKAPGGTLSIDRAAMRL